MLTHRIPRGQAVRDDVIGDTLDLNLTPTEAERRHNRVVKRLAVEADERAVYLLHEAREPSRCVVIMTPQVKPLTRLNVLCAEQSAVR